MSKQDEELKSYGIMLGQIGMYVEDFALAEDSTLVAVLKLLAEYHKLKAREHEEKYHDTLEAIENHSQIKDAPRN